MALNIDQYVCNESVVCNGTVYYSFVSGNTGTLYDIRVTHQRIILSCKSSDRVIVWPLKRLDKVGLVFDSTLNMWKINLSDHGYINVNQLDWANTLFNNIQYYSVFN
jgi:hypothetical protein